jgi:hypothetical protein
MKTDTTRRNLPNVDTTAAAYAASMSIITGGIAIASQPKGAGLASDRTILDAFAARQREFTANYHLTDMSTAEEDTYFKRIDAQEAVIYQTPANTIAGIVAKLRIDFMHRFGTAWSDHAVMTPAAPVFAEGLAADQLARRAWAIIEDLAHIGDVDLFREGR